MRLNQGVDGARSTISRPHFSHSTPGDEWRDNLWKRRRCPKEIAVTAAKVFKKASDAPLDIISLLGERHSGTNWITDHLQECFGVRIKVRDEYTRCKHWFQEDEL